MMEVVLAKDWKVKIAKEVKVVEKKVKKIYHRFVFMFIFAFYIEIAVQKSIIIRCGQSPGREKPIKESSRDAARKACM